MASWWDEDHKLLLVTQEEFDALPDGTVLTCIDDTTVTKGSDDYIDDDTRGGCLAYGVTGDHPLRVAQLEAMASAPARPVWSAPKHTVWSCKIGVIGDLDLPPGSDLPMRRAVEDAFFNLTGKHAGFNFSGWGAQLDEGEYHVAVNAA